MGNDNNSSIAKRVVDAAKCFYDQTQELNHSNKSWEHCYKQFYDARNNPNPNIDNLCLHLAFYLASWGMYRGSSFLLRKDYLIHEPVVREILETEYDDLLGRKRKFWRRIETRPAL